MDKNSLRKEYLEKRNSLKSGEKAAFDAKICSRIISSAEYKASGVVAGFYPIGSEPDIKPVLLDAMKNKTLLLPVCLENGIMEFKKVTDFDELVTGKHNIPSPGADLPVSGLCAIDFMIVPGLVFDREGYRIGYGGGYYDRVIAKLSHTCVTCGVGYSFQCINKLPAEKYDKKIKMFIGEV